MFQKSSSGCGGLRTVCCFIILPDVANCSTTTGHVGQFLNATEAVDLVNYEKVPYPSGEDFFHPVLSSIATNDLRSLFWNLSRHMGYIQQDEGDLAQLMVFLVATSRAVSSSCRCFVPIWISRGVRSIAPHLRIIWLA
jgi:hypothetical protein